jgi:peptidoglycan/LPS O-acetylase OafA/YrhL
MRPRSALSTTYRHPTEFPLDRAIATKGKDAMIPSPPAHPNTADTRRSDLDWLRVLAVWLLVPFHSALVFNLDPGLVAYVKDTVQSGFLVSLKDFLDRWQLEMLFYIAGAASWFALGRRSGRHYLVERVMRLLVPFLFGLVALVPLMINIRWLGRPDAPSLG